MGKGTPRMAREIRPPGLAARCRQSLAPLGLLLLLLAIAAAVGWSSLPAAAAGGAVPPALAPVASPAPTQTTSTLTGQMRRWRPQDGCQGDATLSLCDSPDTLVPVRADPSVNLTRYFGQDVVIEGVVLRCDSGPGEYIMLSQIRTVNRCDVSPPPPKQLNLALGAPVTASGDLPGYDREHLTDGDLDTTWYVETAAAEDRAWAYIDFGQPVTFNQMRLYWAEPYATRYVLYVFDSGYGKWVPIYQTNGGSGGDEQLSLVRSYGQYVLLYLTRSSQVAGDFALREWEVYGVATPNLVLGQGWNVIVSSEQDGLAGANAVDGDRRTRWASRVGDLRPYIVARLPGRSNLTEFRLFWEPSARPFEYRVVFYQGQVPRWEITDLRPLGAEQRISWYTPIPADAFGVFVDEMPEPPGYVALQELELYGPDSGPGPLGGGFGLGATGPGLDLGLRLAAFAGFGMPARAELPLRAVADGSD